MRLICFFLVYLFLMMPARADVVEVPLLADGTVNVDEALSGFKIGFGAQANGAPVDEFSGEMLGVAFAGQIIDGELPQEFILVINAPSLSEHGSYLIAVLATDVICLRRDLSPGEIFWGSRISVDGDSWKVHSSCSTARRRDT